MTRQAFLLPLVKHIFEDDPAAAARHLEAMSEHEAVAVLKTLSPTIATNVVPHLRANYAAALLEDVPHDLFSHIISHIDPQKAAEIFARLPHEKRRSLLDHLPDKTKKLIVELLTYPADSAGRIMSPEVIAFRHDMKVKDAIAKIKHLAQKRFPASYVYVVDDENHLIGVINMRDLMLSSGDTTLEHVMRKDIFSINCFTDREIIAKELSERQFFAAPVVDNENHLLGVVKTDQLIQHVNEEATEDLQKMFGAGGDERAFSPLKFVIRKRLPWLYVNLGTAFLAAAVVALFENIIAKVTILAVFLPVVAGQGGNAGAQSLAVVMRGLVMREIPAHKIKNLIFKEAKAGFINGIVIGIVTAIVAWVWGHNPFLGLVIGLGMIVNLVVAGLAGAGIPIAMKAVGLDPAQSSSIILTTITDVVGFFAFLGFAVVFQGYLT